MKGNGASGTARVAEGTERRIEESKVSAGATQRQRPEGGEGREEGSGTEVHSMCSAVPGFYSGGRN